MTTRLPGKVNTMVVDNMATQRSNAPTPLALTLCARNIPVSTPEELQYNVVLDEVLQTIRIPMTFHLTISTEKSQNALLSYRR